MNIFICYRRDGTLYLADRVYEWLSKRSCGFVFRDVDQIRSYKTILQNLDKALGLSDVVVVLIHPDWAREICTRAATGVRDWVRHEVVQALAAAKVKKAKVIPVLLHRTPMPRAAELGSATDVIPLCDLPALEFPAGTAGQFQLNMTNLAKQIWGKWWTLHCFGRFTIRLTAAIGLLALLFGSVQLLRHESAPLRLRASEVMLASEATPLDPLDSSERVTRIGAIATRVTVAPCPDSNASSCSYSPRNTKQPIALALDPPEATAQFILPIIGDEHDPECARQVIQRNEGGQRTLVFARRKEGLPTDACGFRAKVRTRGGRVENLGRSGNDSLLLPAGVESEIEIQVSGSDGLELTIGAPDSKDWAFWRGAVPVTSVSMTSAEHRAYRDTSCTVVPGDKVVATGGLWPLSLDSVTSDEMGLEIGLTGPTMTARAGNSCSLVPVWRQWLLWMFFGFILAAIGLLPILYCRWRSTALLRALAVLVFFCSYPGPASAAEPPAQVLVALSTNCSGAPADLTSYQHDIAEYARQVLTPLNVHPNYQWNPTWGQLNDAMPRSEWGLFIYSGHGTATGGQSVLCIPEAASSPGSVASAALAPSGTRAVDALIGVLPNTLRGAVLVFNSCRSAFVNPALSARPFPVSVISASPYETSISGEFGKAVFDALGEASADPNCDGLVTDQEVFDALRLVLRRRFPLAAYEAFPKLRREASSHIPLPIKPKPRSECTPVVERVRTIAANLRTIAPKIEKALELQRALAMPLSETSPGGMPTVDEDYFYAEGDNTEIDRIQLRREASHAGLVDLGHIQPDDAAALATFMTFAEVYRIEARCGWVRILRLRDGALVATRRDDDFNCALPRRRMVVYPSRRIEGLRRPYSRPQWLVRGEAASLPAKHSPVPCYQPEGQCFELQSDSNQPSGCD